MEIPQIRRTKTWLNWMPRVCRNLGIEATAQYQDGVLELYFIDSNGADHEVILASINPSQFFTKKAVILTSEDDLAAFLADLLKSVAPKTKRTSGGFINIKRKNGHTWLNHYIAYRLEER